MSSRHEMYKIIKNRKSRNLKRGGLKKISILIYPLFSDSLTSVINASIRSILPPHFVRKLVRKSGRLS